MLYLSQFEFPDADREFDFILAQKKTCYDTYYPFKILSEHLNEGIDRKREELFDEYRNLIDPRQPRFQLHSLEDSVRFFGCQLVIATHSPFFLAMRDAKIYDLSGEGAKVRRWTELANVRVYYDFFKKHESEFESDYE